MSDDIFYVTTPISYPNDVPHRGHAYTTVAADFVCRFRRMQGHTVHFLTGTDEHGQKLMQSAVARGITPKEFVDSMIPRWTEVWSALDISNDDFIRTTDARHEEAVAPFVQAMYDRGHIYLGTYKGLYCIGCEAFKSPDELVDGKCPLHDLVPEEVEEENYFFKLSAFAERLIDLYEKGHFVLPETRRNEVLGKVRQGLDDLSISRVSFDWGIPVPWDARHVIYVWVDALLNYITAIGYPADMDRFDRTWPANVQFVGKDILWFHTVIWPAMLMAVGVEVPETVFAHGFLQVGGEKMSKSKLTGISPHDLIATFGSDGYRYYFMREFSFGLDGEFSWESMAARYNSDLANDLGNLSQRVLAMIARYLDGSIPKPPADAELDDSDRSLFEVQRESFARVTEAVDAINPTDALKFAWAFVRKANAYVEEVAPWVLAKDESTRRRLEVVLYNLADALRLLALTVAPIVPRAADELWRRLGLDGSVADRRYSSDLRWGLLPEDSQVHIGDPLFPRIEDAA
ncbi:MAG: methionyl-tRNA synthetase [Actinomycetota bacterium]|nr:methionyl-tRNA synthetase [Actinomycetota bacterium]